MEIGTQWQHPSSGIDLLEAYPDFAEHIESNKTMKLDWYHPEKRVNGKTYQ
jgi:LruC domain-containing protein